MSISGVFDFGVSGHQVINCTRKCKGTPINEHNCVNIRILKNYTKVAFQEKLSNMNWHEVIAVDSVHEVWYLFKCKFLGAVDSSVQFNNFILNSAGPIHPVHVILRFICKHLAHNIIKCSHSRVHI